MAFTVTVEPLGRTISAQAGDNLLEVLRSADCAPEAPCGGNGTCGKCKVTIDGEECLACQTIVQEDLVVSLPDRTKTEVLVDGCVVEAKMDPVAVGSRALLAFDIGTTTVVCFLLDGETGEELAHASMLNPQAPFGADVISRIRAALDGKLEEETASIRQGLTSLIEQVCADARIAPAEIGVLSIVGNPTMQQLFMGISPENLAEVPFAPVLTEARTLAAADYLPCLENAVFLVVPDIAGYVGADTMGCVLSTRMYEADELTLMIDIGTNGEMVLGNRGRLAACATAAGPAFEGAGIEFGMRGAPGAINGVKIEGGLDGYRASCTVIGDIPATGICGSGIISAMAACLDAGLVNKRGRILTDDERIHLTDQVYLTQQDIREIQLAKGAIAAGIRMLAAHMDTELEGIDRILMAGAFGSFLDVDAACRIGLLPKELQGRIESVGNAAGSGARLLACDKEQFALAQELVEKVEFIELAELPDFQRTFGLQTMFTD